MKGGLGNIMQQAQKMQADMQQAQEELKLLEVEGKSGGGLVSVVMLCSHEVKRINIDDSLLGDDKDMLEDLVVAAINDAVHKVAKTTQEKMSGLTGGMKLPPGMKLPF